MTGRATRAAQTMLVVLAMTGGTSCSVKTIDRDQYNRPWDRKTTRPAPDALYGCRLFGHQPMVTLMFYKDSSGDCVLTNEHHETPLITKRGGPAIWDLCNTCDVDIDVWLNMRGWTAKKGPLSPGPWLEACSADAFELEGPNRDRERLRRNVPKASKHPQSGETRSGHAYITCRAADRDVMGGEVVTTYGIDVRDLGSSKKPRSFDTGDAKITDH